MDQRYPVRPSKSSSEVLFCPFCRESFEDETKCPEHELLLVPFAALPGATKPLGIPHDDELLLVFDLRFGRGIAGAGALLAVLGFLCPIGEITAAAERLIVTGPSIAITHAPTLWVVPGVGVAVLALLATRRTLSKMRAIRLVIPLLAWGVPMSVWSALRKLDRWAGMMSVGDAPAVAHYGWGLGVLGLATVLMMIGGLRLGVTREPPVLPHGAEPESARSRIEIDHDDDVRGR